MKRLFFAEAVRPGPLAVSLAFWGVLCAVGLEAQSISITNPSSRTPTITGSSNTFTVSYSGATIGEVCYTLDAYPLYNPGINAPTTYGCSIAPPFSIQYNSYWNGNGAHTLTAVAYNALGSVVATSSPVSFNIANTWPNPNSLAMSVSYGTSPTSNWSGQVSVTPSFTGTGAGTDSLTYNLNINGVQQGQTTFTATSATLYAQTTNFPNGPADVCVSVNDNTSGSTYTGQITFLGGIYESCVQVTFANNSSATNIAKTNAHDIYLTGGGPYGGTCDAAAVGSGSCTLTSAIQNTDGSTTTGTNYFCAAMDRGGFGGGGYVCASPNAYGSNTLPFTVNSSTGLITANAGGVGNGMVIAMTANVTGTDLTVVNSGAYNNVTSASHPFTSNQFGEALAVTGGTGWTTGMWTIGSYTSGVNYAGLNCTGSSDALCPAGMGATNGQFAAGPARYNHVFIAPSNMTPCFGKNGVVYTSYNSSCYVMHSMFNPQGLGGAISALAADQSYNPGAVADFSASAIKTFEMGDIGPPVPNNGINGSETSSGFSAWDSGLQTYVSNQENILSQVPGATAFLIDGGALTDSQAALWGTTYGPAASWSTPPFQDMLTRWSSYGNVTALNFGDEYPWGVNPLQGPIVFSSGTGQSWLQSITASGGTCTVPVGIGSKSGGVMGASLTSAPAFIIHGSSIPGMNSVAPAVYTATVTPGSNAAPVAAASGSTVTITMTEVGQGYSSSNPPTVVLVGGGGTYTSATPTINGSGQMTGITVTGASGYTSNPTVVLLPNFTFSCSSVADGTYNSTNDPGLTIEPLTPGWVHVSGTYEYTPYDVFARLASQAAAVSSPLAIGAAPVGATIGVGAQGFAYWFGNTLNTSQSIRSISQVGKFADLYPEVGSFHNFLMSRKPAQDLLISGNIAWTIRATYGVGFSPSLPLDVLTHGGEGNYWGINGNSVALASCSGHACTFSSAHGVTNLIPGMSRIGVSGATDSGSPQDTTNQNFIIWDAPSPTALDVVLSRTDQVASGTGGMLTFQDGSTFPLTSITALGTDQGSVGGKCNINIGQVYPEYGGYLCGDALVVPYGTSILTKRGQTFTISGSISGTNVSFFTSNTFLLSPENISSPESGSTMTLSYREVPSLSATGGTALVITDDNYVKGPRNPSNNIGTFVTPEFQFGEVIEAIWLRAAAERVYQYLTANSGYDPVLHGYTGPTSFLPVIFGGGNNQLQTSLHQHFENSAAVPSFRAHNSAALYWNRYAKYWFQPRLNSPDYGPYVECAAAAGTPGDIMGCMNISDGPLTITFNLSPYLQSGQQIIEQLINDRSIGPDTILGAGTTSATLTLQPYDVASFVFPANFAAELKQPSISVRLADVANANDIVVRWAYDRYYLDVFGDTYDCGTGTCTPSWDRNIGTIYYRILYRNSAGQVIATSDVQQL